MESSFLSSVVLPLCLIAMMFGMGLSLVPGDFLRVFSKIKPTVLGLVCQVLLLPLFAFVLALVFQLEHNLAIGLMILSLAPGAVTSNFFTYLVRANVALSVSLTAIVSFIAPLTLPLMLTLAMKYFSSPEEQVSLPLAKTIVSLFAITLVPISAGMLVRRSFEAFANRSEKFVRIFSTVVLVLIVLGLLRQHWDIVPRSFGSVGLVCLFLNLGSLVGAYVLSHLANLSRRDAITIAIETGFQSSVTALFIAGTLLKQGEMAIVPAVYSLVMLFTGAGIVWWLSKKEKSWKKVEELQGSSH